MKKILLLLALLPVLCFGQKKIGSFPDAPRVDSNSYFLGTQSNGMGGFTDYLFWAGDIWSFIKDSVQSDSGSINIYNSNGTLNGSRLVTGSKTYGIQWGEMTKFIVQDTSHQYPINVSDNNYPDILRINQYTGVFRLGTYNAKTYITTPASPDAIIMRGENGVTVSTQGDSGGHNVPFIMASKDTIGVTATIALCTYTTAKASTYSVGSYLNITAVSSSAILLEVSWTDENNVSQTKALGSSGTSGFSLNATYTFRAKKGSIITVSATRSGSSITYDCGAYLTQMY